MPSKTEAQHNLMEGAAHNPAFAKKVGVPQSVGREFVAADKGKFNGPQQRATAHALRHPKPPPTGGSYSGFSTQTGYPGRHTYGNTPPRHPLASGYSGEDGRM